MWSLGIGKSTLIRCINGLETCDSGSIVVNGIELTQRAESVAKIRSVVGMVFQQFNLFPHLSALENCTLALTEELGLTQSQADEKAMQYLSRVRIADQPLNDQPNCRVDNNNVSHRQGSLFGARVNAFRRTYLSTRPEMISEVLETMVSLAEDGMSMICVTHDLVSPGGCSSDYFYGRGSVS